MSADRCRRTRTCALVDDHGGMCDPRPESERWAALFALVDANVPTDEIEKRMDQGAREAFGRLPS